MFTFFVKLEDEPRVQAQSLLDAFEKANDYRKYMPFRYVSIVVDFDSSSNNFVYGYNGYFTSSAVKIFYNGSCEQVLESFNNVIDWFQGKHFYKQCNYQTTIKNVNSLLSTIAVFENHNKDK